MESLLSLEFWAFGLFFLIAVFFVWIFPGLLLLKSLRIRLEIIGQFVLALVLGLALWGLQAYVFGYLNLRFLTYAYVGFGLVASLLHYKYLRQEVSSFVIGLVRLPKIILFLTLTGVLVQSVQTFGTGLVGSQGMAFFRVHMQDGIYHLSMIQSMVRAFPPMEPGAVGTLVQNYHYWSDLILAEVVRVFGMPANFVFFQYFPPVVSLFTALATLSILQLWTKRKSVWFFGLGFLFFGADLGYLMNWLIHGVVSFQYPVIDNGATQFLNMPHAVAKLVFTTSLIPLWFWLKEKKWKWGFVAVLLTAILFGIKIYFGLFAVLGLAFITLYYLLNIVIQAIRRRSISTDAVSIFKQLLVCGLMGGLLALAIYLPPNKASGGLTYTPLEWPKLMLAEGNLDWRDWRYKHAVAELEGLKAKIVFYDMEAIVITLLAIHGTRILGLFVSRKTIREIGGVWTIYLLVPSILFTFVGLYTLQVSGNFNVFNFFATSLVPLSILASFLFAEMWSMKVIGKLAVVILVIFTMPRIIFETQKILASYSEKTDVLYLSKGEMAALASIDRNYPETCIVSSSLSNEVDQKTPYVSYFANRPTYMSGYRVLETHNAPVLDRYLDFKRIFAGNEPERIKSELQSQGVCALYLRKEDELIKYFQIHVKLSFENDEAVVVDLR